MHLAAVILLMLVLPAASVAIEALRTPGAADLAFIGKWFTFLVVPAAIVGGHLLWFGWAWPSLPPEPELQRADGARFRPRDIRLARRLRCEPCLLESARANVTRSGHPSS